MERYHELMEMIPDDKKTLLRPLIKEMAHMEKRLDILRELPTVKVNEENPSQQKVLPVAKVYKELIQQYTNLVKVVCKAIGLSSEGEEESPLRAYLKKVQNNG